jgi:hypothetical protein
MEKMDTSSNPFHVGDKVQFLPNQRAQGWSWFGPGTIHPHDVGIVSRLEDRDYVYMKQVDTDPDSPEVGGFHWECFRKVE